MWLGGSLRLMAGSLRLEGVCFFGLFGGEGMHNINLRV